MSTHRNHLSHGRLLRSWRNECKLTIQQVAEECAINTVRLQELEHGCSRPSWDELERLAERYSVSVRDLLPRRDDRERGVKILRNRDAAQIEQTRADRLQYTYYHRATSSTLPDFRPVELVLHFTDPTAVILNKGHFFHQYTQVLHGGPVGFLWSWQDEVCHEILTVGDSWIIPGFVPHGFYSADKSHLGRILAVTFGCHLTGDAREELAIMGGRQAVRIVDSEDYYE